MNIEIQKTKKNAALLRAMANDDIMEAYKARQAFAAYITEPTLQIIEAYAVLDQLFTARYTYEQGQPSMIPLAPLFDVRDAGYIRVWFQSRPGGLATSTPVDASEYAVQTWERQGAVSIPLHFMRAARVDVLAAYLEHLAGNFLAKDEADSATVITNMIATTTYQLRGTATRQVYRTLNQATVLPQDISAIERLMTRINQANIGGGTPLGASNSVTTLVGSPEFAEEIRNMAFEPLNNTLRATYPLAGPEKLRNEIYDAGGRPTIYGKEIMVVNQMGQNEAYNILFSDAGTGLTFPGYAAGTAAAFSPGSEEIVFCVDRRRKSLAVITEENPDSGSTMRVRPDNQFVDRAEEVGFWARRRYGKCGVDGRGICGLVW